MPGSDNLTIARSCDTVVIERFVPCADIDCLESRYYLLSIVTIYIQICSLARGTFSSARYRHTLALPPLFPTNVPAKPRTPTQPTFGETFLALLAVFLAVEPSKEVIGVITPTGSENSDEPERSGANAGESEIGITQVNYRLGSISLADLRQTWRRIYRGRADAIVELLIRFTVPSGSSESDINRFSSRQVEKEPFKSTVR
jgi:hypothetical protein